MTADSTHSFHDFVPTFNHMSHDKLGIFFRNAEIIMRRNKFNLLLLLTLQSYLLTMVVIFVHSPIRNALNNGTQTWKSLRSRSPNATPYTVYKSAAKRAAERSRMGREMKGNTRWTDMLSETISTPGVCSNQTIIIAIKSAIGETRRREVIRDTWGRQFLKCQLFFALGDVTQQDNKSSAVNVTHELWSDPESFLTSNFEDTYFNNTRKTISIMKYFHQSVCAVDQSASRQRTSGQSASRRKTSGQSASVRTPHNQLASGKALIIMDSDMMLYRPSLEAYIRSFMHEHHRVGLHGVCFNGADVQREGKWSVSITEHPSATYPEYCMGAMVMMNCDTVARFMRGLAQAKTMPFTHIDDLLIYGFLANKLRIPRRDLPPRRSMMNSQSNLTKATVDAFLFGEFKTDVSLRRAYRSMLLTMHRFMW